jgi:hypothetical protein
MVEPEMPPVVLEASRVNGEPVWPLRPRMQRLWQVRSRVTGRAATVERTCHSHEEVAQRGVSR